MKKTLIALLVAVLPLGSYAQIAGIYTKQNSPTKIYDYTPYLQGTVPVINGKVTFTKEITATGKNKSDLYKRIASWASVRYMPNTENGKWTDPTYFRNLEMPTVKAGDENESSIVCQGHEELVFSNKFLSKDFTQAEYKLNIQISEGAITATMTDIVYFYSFSSKKERVNAEEIITDDRVFNRKGNFIKSFLKFRVKTIDLAKELFSEIENVCQ